MVHQHNRQLTSARLFGYHTSTAQPIQS